MDGRVTSKHPYHPPVVLEGSNCYGKVLGGDELRLPTQVARLRTVVTRLVAGPRYPDLDHPFSVFAWTLLTGSHHPREALLLVHVTSSVGSTLGSCLNHLVTSMISLATVVCTLWQASVQVYLNIGRVLLYP